MVAASIGAWYDVPTVATVAVRPPEIDQIADRLLAVYHRAWLDVEAQQAALTDDPALWRQRRRLREVERSIRAAMDDVDRQAREWIRRQLPTVYAAGAEGEATSAAPFRWTQIHTEAVAELAADTFDDLLAATAHVRSTTKQLIRTLARQRTAAALVEGQTATQAARDLARLLDRNRITAVVYRDGSRHGLADYSQVVIRTKTAVAHNTGTANQLRAAGTEWVEVFDGHDCGLSSHDDPDKVNGTIRRLSTMVRHPVAHPNCRRSWGGRPDITSAEQAKGASPSTTPAQRVDQAASERARAVAQSERRQRAARTARRPRTARTARA